ncbi:MAG: hypothetical protein JSR39_02185 [Verrucomicrobia bacterium]|nr:hypothetical protein [Verrucomicrobiota bacterium]
MSELTVNNNETTTTAGNSTAAPALPKASLEDFSAAVGLVAGALTDMTALMGQNSSKISSDNAEMQEGMMQVYMQQEQDAENNLQQQLTESHKHGIFHKVESHAKLIGECAVMAGGLATGQFELCAAVATTMLMSHYASQISAGVADLCMKIDPSMNPNVAAMIGDAVTTVVIAVAVVAAGQGASLLDDGSAEAKIGEKVTKTAAKEAGTELSDVAEEGATDAAEAVGGAAGATTATESSVQLSSERIEGQVTEAVEKKAENTLLDQVKSVLNTINPFNKHTAINEFALGLAQGWSGTGGTNDALKVSGNDSMKMEIIANAITGVLTLAVSAGSMGGMMSSSAELKGAKSTEILQASRFVRNFAMLTQAVAGVGAGAYSGKMAVTEKKYGHIEANLENVQFNLELISQENQNNIKTLSNTMNDCFTDIQSLYNTLSSTIGTIAQEMYA